MAPWGRIYTKLGGNCSQEFPAPVSEVAEGESNQEPEENPRNPIRLEAGAGEKCVFHVKRDIYSFWRGIRI